MANGTRLDLERALAEATIGPGAQRRIPFQIRRAALERAPTLTDPNVLNSPLLAPIFGEGAIPPVLDQADDGLSDVGVDLGTGQGTFTGEPIDLGQISVGQPVPPVKASRGERLRKLLGNFLQNFGEGLTAASRAPSGAGFAAGFGAALSAPEERRRQQMFEDMLRARQASRLAEAAERKRRFDVALAAGEAEREQERITEENAANRALELKLAEIDADQAAATIGGIEKKRARSFRQVLEERKFRRGIKGQKEILRFQDILARGKPGKFPQGQRTNLADAIASRIENIQGSELIPGGGFRARLKISKIRTRIDKLFRGGLDPDSIARLFERSIQGLIDNGKPVTLEEVLGNIQPTPQ